MTFLLDQPYDFGESMLLQYRVVIKMIHIDKAIIVEGKYDKIKLSSIFDATIIVTDGFSIYKNSELSNLIRFYADNGGIIILTDSDSAGFKIRNYIKGFVSNDKITNVYIPEIIGKEKRKDKPSKEGTLGVEGIDKDVIIEAFETAGVLGDCVTSQNRESNDCITNLDLYDLGLIGVKDSKRRRRDLLNAMGLPGHISTNALLELLNKAMSRTEFLDKCSKELLG